MESLYFSCRFNHLWEPWWVFGNRMKVICPSPRFANHVRSGQLTTYTISGLVLDISLLKKAVDFTQYQILTWIKFVYISHNIRSWLWWSSWQFILHLDMDEVLTSSSSWHFTQYQILTWMKFLTASVYWQSWRWPWQVGLGLALRRHGTGCRIGL